MSTPEAARSWRMWAGQRVNHGETEPVFCNIGDHPMYARMHGHADPIPVLAVEDPDGRYWGWLTNLNRDRDAEPEYESAPCMIYDCEGIFSVCFPYGYRAEVERNAGRVVRLTMMLDSMDAPG